MHSLKWPLSLCLSAKVKAYEKDVAIGQTIFKALFWN